MPIIIGSGIVSLAIATKTNLLGNLNLCFVMISNSLPI